MLVLKKLKKYTNRHHYKFDNDSMVCYINCWLVHDFTKTSHYFTLVYRGCTFIIYNNRYFIRYIIIVGNKHITMEICKVKQTVNRISYDIEPKHQIKCDEIYKFMNT